MGPLRQGILKSTLKSRRGAEHPPRAVSCIDRLRPVIDPCSLQEALSALRRRWGDAPAQPARALTRMPVLIRFFLAVWVVAFHGMPSLWSRTPAASALIDFNAQVRPLLSARCFSCHGPDEGARKANLRLDVRDQAVQQQRGSHAIKPGDPARSLVMTRITTDDVDDVMPPPKAGPRLTASEIAVLRRWIEEGASYADHWAWKPPVRASLPPVKQRRWTRNPIDHFILARLQDAGLKPSTEAQRSALLRRVSLDLTGLPPSPELRREFAEDKRADAYERLVDRLLASPAYGEHWARMWMDLGRYADSAGYGSDPLRPNLWPWRDWVIDALNRNMSYDQFTLEQIAGDLMPHATDAQKVATAFHRNTMTNTEGGTDDEEYRVAAVKDRANTTAQVWMGLTLGCAQCHSHKYDPLSQHDYYRFFAFFNQTEDHDQPDERPTLPRPTAEEAARIQGLQDRIADLERKRSGATPAFEADLQEWETRQRQPTPWRLLKPERIQSLTGTTFEMAGDGSVLAKPKAETDTYVIRANLASDRLSALRLELLPHPSLPEGGHGHGHGTGLAQLTEFQAAVRAPQAAWPKARFVRIELPGPRRVLSLAEVQVLRDGTNVSSTVAATQSSSDGAGADRAVDGQTEGHFDLGSVTLTRPQDHPWWEVDLGAEHPVEEIVIWNRTDRGLGTRLSDFKVLALDEHRKPTWEKAVSQAPTPAAFFRLPPETALKLQNATADRSAADQIASQAIDGNFDLKNGWRSTSPVAQPSFITFELEATNSYPAGSRLFLTLSQHHGTNHTLGHFRLAVSEAPLPIRELPHDLRAVLEIPLGLRTAAQSEQIAAHVRDLAPSLATINRDLQKLKRELDAIKPVALPILKELPPEKRRTSRFLHKGNFLDPGDPVEPGVPEAFHAWPAEAPPNRLGLARWLVSPDNPLTARVAVNRLWARVFGAGLVETEEDFGTQGTLPTHPALLDWLAIEFMEQGWDTHAILRLMVTSATYRQSSAGRPDLLERDPRNRWYARMSRRRLDAEMIRDQALAISGLLSYKQGGPSVFPPQPDGLWRAAFNGERSYPTSKGEDRYRRGLYTFIRRTVPNPSLAAFDAPSRESCTFRRLPTNTPLQAYVTLNDPVFVECAQSLARRILRESPASTDLRIRYGLELCLGRAPLKDEKAILTRHLELELAHYQSRESEARQLATDPLGPLPPGVHPVEAAAWTSVANVLLNLDGVLTRN